MTATQLIKNTFLISVDLENSNKSKTSYQHSTNNRNLIGNGHPILVITLYVKNILINEDMLAGNNFPDIFDHLMK